MYRADDDPSTERLSQRESVPPDDAFRVLAHRYRRTVVKSLLGCKHGVPVETLISDLMVHGDPPMDDPRSRIAAALYHVHLPKMADLEFIKWDRAHKVVTPTARLSSLEPLVQGITLGRFYR